MEAVAADNGFQIIFIHAVLFIQYRLEAGLPGISKDKADVDSKRELGIGNHGGKQECVGMPTIFTKDTYHKEGAYIVSKTEGSPIGAVTDQASGMAAGTENQVQIKRIYGFIIKILRKMVVVFCLNCYHKYGCSVSYVLVKAEIKL